jgi:hypothetical protein
MFKDDFLFGIQNSIKLVVFFHENLTGFESGVYSSH